MSSQLKLSSLSLEDLQLKRPCVWSSTTFMNWSYPRSTPVTLLLAFSFTANEYHVSGCFLCLMCKHAQPAHYSGSLLVILTPFVFTWRYPRESYQLYTPAYSQYCNFPGDTISCVSRGRRFTHNSRGAGNARKWGSWRRKGTRRQTEPNGAYKYLNSALWYSWRALRRTFLSINFFSSGPPFPDISALHSSRFTSALPVE